MLSECKSILPWKSYSLPCEVPGRRARHNEPRLLSTVTSTITILQRRIRIRAPISDANVRGIRLKMGWGMTEQQDRRAQEREEIAARVASFKATQEKFRREREEYFFTTLENARHS
jgi:hypothetical protein